MPTYCYECPRCIEKFEVFRSSMSASNSFPICPYCNEKGLAIAAKRIYVVGNIGIQIK